ncbi:c-type cytochrome [Lewinella sp. W8]|nr:c-type cytochrome [Lewinella sp. W8]
MLVACGSPEPTPYSPAEPDHFAKILYPEDNPTTEEGLALGRRLFFDPILSADSTISCSSCHLPERAFSDGRRVSVGINGRPGTRNAPGLANVGYLHRTLFWDGRADNLENQAIHPVGNPNEMGGSWELALDRLQRHPDYRERFRAAFGLSRAEAIQRDHVGKALAQFQRALISGNSKYDRVQMGRASFTEAEALGEAIFFDFADDPTGPYAALPTGECAHCHTPPHFTNQQFANNGLEEARALTDFTDRGRGMVSGTPFDFGRFRTPPLRNVALTAPYMHDGRFQTLEEVIAHYNRGGHYAENKSPNVVPLGLDSTEAAALVAFLTTLTDSAFLNNQSFHSPF